MVSSRWVDLLLAVLCLGCGVWIGAPKVSGQTIDFNRDIRPILAEYCFVCHGPDEGSRQADLRLDDRESAISLGVIVPGAPAESALIERIDSDDPDWIMPPPHSRKTLTRHQRRLLADWIQQGASYDTHWAYRPIRRPLPPPGRPDATIRNPIDAFVVAALESVGLSQGHEASRETLLRRLYLDLVGLPPSPAAVQAFREALDPLAYERIVDQLLASPHFGERLAPLWLDVVRYADTVGYHGDQNQNAFAYRDWVINALNENMPFDQFTIEQLAGDLLPEPTESNLIATCFNRLNMMTREGGAQPDEYLAKYAADRVRTVGAAWLGSTIGCAECHDHKYDPFTMQDFYSLAAFFADIQQWGVYQDYEYTPNPDLRHWSNDHPFPPELDVAIPYLQRRQDQFIAKRDHTLQQQLELIASQPHADAAFRAWLMKVLNFLSTSDEGWRWLKPTPLPGEGLANGSPIDNVTADVAKSQTTEGQTTGIPWIQIDSNQAAKLELEIDGASLQDAPPWTSLRIDFDVVDETLFSSEISSASVRVTIERATADGQKRQPVPIWHADASDRLPRYSNGFEIVGIQSTWLIPNRRHRIHSVWTFAQPLQLNANEKLVITIHGIPTSRLALAMSPLVPDYRGGNHWQMLERIVEDLVSLSSVSSMTASAEMRSAVRQWILSGGAVDMGETLNAVRQWERDVIDCRNGRWPVMITVSQTPRVTRILPRGNWQDTSGREVAPAFPSFLTEGSHTSAQRLTRLDLARWLVSDDNPLTARVQVNRLWKHFLGTGLSAVLDDLGRQGDYPTHAELLDWLASEFRESGWNVKHLVRLIVTSATYRQTSRPSPAALERDPQNRWLSHQNARRLEAEIIRDNALAIGGLLQLDMGGPPIFPYQPDNYYAHLQFPDRRYQANTDSRQYRRGVYMHWQRTFLHPMLVNFDAPSREECTGMRIEANTPQQALNLLNDPTFVEAARGLALALWPIATDESRVRAAFERALCRPPTAEEIASLLDFLACQRSHWRENPDDVGPFLSVGLSAIPSDIDPVELASWTSVARAILNLHETITRY